MASLWVTAAGCVSEAGRRQDPKLHGRGNVIHTMFEGIAGY